MANRAAAQVSSEEVLQTPEPPPGPWVAAVQMCSTDDVARNLALAEGLVRQAAAAGAQLVGLPENFAYLGAQRDHKQAIAEAIPAGPGGPDAEVPEGPILTAMRQLARNLNIWLLLGGFPEKSSAEVPARIHNTSLLLGPDGGVTARYRKIHLFNVEVPGGQQFREADDVLAGDEPVVTATPWGPLGLSICYDLRFPELYRLMAARGARFAAVPSAFTRQTGKDHWHVLLRARAVENQMFVIAPAQHGEHGGKRASYGHALVVDPWGTVIAECGDHDGFALARLDTAYQDRVRDRLPCLSHRRL